MIKYVLLFLFLGFSIFGDSTSNYENSLIGDITSPRGEVYKDIRFWTSRREVFIWDKCKESLITSFRIGEGYKESTYCKPEDKDKKACKNRPIISLEECSVAELTSFELSNGVKGEFKTESNNETIIFLKLNTKDDLTQLRVKLGLKEKRASVLINNTIHSNNETEYNFKKSILIKVTALDGKTIKEYKVKQEIFSHKEPTVNEVLYSAVVPGLGHYYHSQEDKSENKENTELKAILFSSFFYFTTVALYISNNKYNQLKSSHSSTKNTIFAITPNDMTGVALYTLSLNSSYSNWSNQGSLLKTLSGGLICIYLWNLADILWFTKSIVSVPVGDSGYEGGFKVSASTTPYFMNGGFVYDRSFEAMYGLMF